MKVEGGIPDKQAGPIDLAMGQRIRARRLALSMTQQDLAKRVGVSFQQIYKYEHGRNRVSFARLVLIATALEWTFSELVKGLETVPPEVEADELHRLLGSDGAVELLQIYAALTSPSQQRALVCAARALLAAESTGPTAPSFGRK